MVAKQSDDNQRKAMTSNANESETMQKHLEPTMEPGGRVRRYRDDQLGDLRLTVARTISLDSKVETHMS